MKRKLIVLSLIIIAVILVAIAVVFPKKNTKSTNQSNLNEINYIESELLAKEKNYNGFNLYNLKVRVYNKKKYIVTLKVKNDTTNVLQEKVCTLVLLDSNLNELEKIPTILPSLQVNEMGSLEVSASVDLSKIYDYKIIDNEGM